MILFLYEPKHTLYEHIICISVPSRDVIETCCSRHFFHHNNIMFSLRLRIRSELSQLTFTFLKLTIETLEQGVKSVQS